MACYIRERINYNVARRWPEDDSEDDEFEDAVFSPPEVFDIDIFGMPVYALYTNSENSLNWRFSHCIRNLNLRYPRRAVGLHIQLVDPVEANPPVAAISLCVFGHVIIYHMYNASTLPRALEQFMTTPNNVFVGVNMERGLGALRYWGEYNGPIAYRSLGLLAAQDRGQPELLHANITELALDVLGEDLTLDVDGEEFGMEEVYPDWDNHTLLDEQIMAASIGAYVSYKLGMVLPAGH